jgi:transcriptional regulator with XRE-family HTH domain
MRPVDYAAAEYIRRTLTGKSITQGTIAGETGISLPTFGRYYRGEAPIQLGDFGAILDALGESYEDAMEEIRRLLPRYENQAD